MRPWSFSPSSPSAKRKSRSAAARSRSAAIPRIGPLRPGECSSCQEWLSYKPTRCAMALSLRFRPIGKERAIRALWERASISPRARSMAGASHDPFGRTLSSNENDALASRSGRFELAESVRFASGLAGLPSTTSRRARLVPYGSFPTGPSPRSSRMKGREERDQNRGSRESFESLAMKRLPPRRSMDGRLRGQSRQFYFTCLRH